VVEHKREFTQPILAAWVPLFRCEMWI